VHSFLGSLPEHQPSIESGGGKLLNRAVGRFEGLNARDAILMQGAQGLDIGICTNFDLVFEELKSLFGAALLDWTCILLHLLEEIGVCPSSIGAIEDERLAIVTTSNHSVFGCENQINKRKEGGFNVWTSPGAPFEISTNVIEESCATKPKRFPLGDHLTAWTHPPTGYSAKSSPNPNLSPKAEPVGFSSSPLM